jgi:hypothetical protein
MLDEIGCDPINAAVTCPPLALLEREFENRGRRTFVGVVQPR